MHKPIRWCLVAACVSLYLVRATLPAALSAGNAPLKIVSVSENQELSHCFQQSSGWTGADAAYSVLLDKDTALWLFGDTYIGRVVNGRRVDATMINNSVAVQKLSFTGFAGTSARRSAVHNASARSDAPTASAGTPQTAPGRTPPTDPGRTSRTAPFDNSLSFHSSFNFYWNSFGTKPSAIFKPESTAEEFGAHPRKQLHSVSADSPTKTRASSTDRSVGSPTPPDVWFWPGDAIVRKNKLYVFLHKVRRKVADSSNWGFVGDGDELACVDNPDDLPTRWRIARVKLPSKIDWGPAAVVDGDYVYAYANYPAAAVGMFKHPAVLARISLESLEKMQMDAWQIFSAKSQWENLTSFEGAPQVIMADAAPELSVCRIRGISGFIATYTPAGLGEDIVIRHADFPQGPWSAPQLVYRAKDPGKGRFTYAAKAHAEQSSRNGEVVITYCRNSVSLQDNADHADLYCPRAINVLLQERK